MELFETEEKVANRHKFTYVRIISSLASHAYFSSFLSMESAELKLPVLSLTPLIVKFPVQQPALLLVFLAFTDLNYGMERRNLSRMKYVTVEL